MAFSLETDTTIQEKLTPLDYNISVPNHESNMAPCMIARTDETIVINIEELEEKFTLIDTSLSFEIKRFYRSIKSSSQEIYIKEWTLFSIDNIYNMLLNHRENNIHITDIGLKYCGMGHCKVAFYDPQTNMIYYRHDGGSNRWDREEKYNALKNYKSDSNNSGLTFDIFLKQINKELNENECLF